MKLLAPMLSAACALLWFAAASANAAAYVDRNLSQHLQNVTGQPSNSTATGAAAPPNGGSQSSYTVSVASPTIYKKNMVYTTPFPLPPHIDGVRVTITNVVWQYGANTQPTGFEASLCLKNNKCVNVSKLSTGQTATFNGLDALQPFVLQYQVVGLGSLSSPVVSENAQIVVTYHVW
jgi:hypothetical protein